MEFDLDSSIDVLARTPTTLQTLLGDLAEPWIRGVEGPDTFSPFDVVGHLIDGDETDWVPGRGSFSPAARTSTSSPMIGSGIVRAM